MGTRLYTAPTTVPDISPNFSTGWDKTTGALRRKLSPVLIDRANAQHTRAGNGVANTNVLFDQFVYGPLSAQTIAGFLKGQLRVFETGLTDDYMPQLRAYVVNSDGSVTRGVLLELHADALSNEFAITTLTNRKFPKGWTGSGVTLIPVNAQAGDFLVIEPGFRQASTSVANAQVDLRTDQAADLAENETDTGNANSWFEFSQNINVPLGPYSARASVTGTVVNQPCRLRQIVVITKAGAGSFVLRDGGASGQVRVPQVDTPAGAGQRFTIDIPAAGVKFLTDMHATLSNCELICWFN